MLDLPGVVLFVSVKLKSSYSQGDGLEKQWECLKKHGGDFRLNLAVKNELEQDEDGAKKKALLPANGCGYSFCYLILRDTSQGWTFCRK